MKTLKSHILISIGHVSRICDTALDMPPTWQPSYLQCKIVMMLGTAMSSPADVGLDLSNKDYRSDEETGFSLQQ